MNNLLIPKKERHFLPNTIEISWDAILPFFNELINRELNSLADLTQWMIDRSELEAITAHPIQRSDHFQLLRDLPANRHNPE